MDKTMPALLQFSLIIAVITSTGCGDTTMKTMPSRFQTDTIQEEEWNSLSVKKIYFGHQSVGYNIIDGIRDLMKINHKIKLNIQETVDLSNYQNGVFAHSQNGENGNPQSKINSFALTMRTSMGKHADIAFFKFCYVDFNENTDVKYVFDHYKKAMNELKIKYPGTVFLHATVPLTTEEEFLGVIDRVKDIIKKIIGRTTYAEKIALSNIKRNEYNVLLLKEYGKGSVIDVAAYESIGPDGQQYLSINSGPEHPTMAPANTFDGGHLNEKGRILVADKFLVELTKKR